LAGIIVKIVDTNINPIVVIENIICLFISLNS
jgi:hypothetical protein